MSSSDFRTAARCPSTNTKKIRVTWEPGPEERNEMIRVAAYYIAERDGFKSGEAEYWALAENHVNLMLALRESQEKLQIIIDTALDAVVLIDAKGIITGWSNHAEIIFGWPTEQAVGRLLHETILPHRFQKAHLHGIERFLATGEGQILNSRIEVSALHRDGYEFPVELSVVPIKMAEKYEFSAFIRDITERKHAEEELRIAAIAFETQEGIIITDAHSVIQRANRAFTKITGYTQEEAIGQTPRLLKSGRQDASFYAAMWESLHRTGIWQGEILNRRKNGEVYPEHLTITAVKRNDGEITHYIATMNDITERKQAEGQIYDLAFHDALTRLPNRRMLNDRLGQAIATSHRSGLYGALMFIDLDNFKPLNDTHGHGVGDLLLIEAADRLKNCVREMDTVARFGGDEFVVMLCELNANRGESISQAEIVAEKIRSTLSAPYLLTVSHRKKANITVEHHCTASIGVAMFINHETSQEDIVKHADAAMYQAKKDGRNLIRFYRSETD